MNKTTMVAVAFGLGGGLLAAQAWADHSRVTVPTWSYLCFEGEGAADVMEKANQAGARGWEMVSAGLTRGGTVWCFRQPRWARPVPAE